MSWAARTILVLALLLPACAKRPAPEPPAAPKVWTAESSLVEVSPPALADLGEPKDLERSLEQSLAYLQRQAATAEIRFGPDLYTVAKLRESLEDFRSKLRELGIGPALYGYLRDSYRFYSSAAPELLFTGYFEAHLKGSRKRGGPYQHPLYRRPDDLYSLDLKSFFPGKDKGELPATLRGRIEGKKFVPYYSREEIDYGGKLTKRGLELAWVDDELDAFFLQVQGSGIVSLEEGGSINVNYAESNGHPYRSIGNYLVKQGVPKEQVNLRSLKAYLRSHPEEVRTILSTNPSYVFFRTVDRGPIGSLQVPLNPLRSIATDSKIFPKGALAWISTDLPEIGADGELAGSEPWSAFVLNQDTGGAIVGAGRVDLFMGRDEERAGFMQQKGKLYFLIKR